LNVEKPEKSKTNITNTLAQTKKDNNVPSSDSGTKNAVSTNTNAASTMNRKAKQSTAREKQNYNIGIDEVTDNRMN
ncbi:MAG: sel1 repeat family protein, partial [Pseudoleptotrichia goodfellowii]|nr:sel1 repeat family protein [Pseudoleptotrichia goodfellowii]